VIKVSIKEAAPRERVKKGRGSTAPCPSCATAPRACAARKARSFQVRQATPPVLLKAKLEADRHAHLRARQRGELRTEGCMKMLSLAPDSA